MVRRPPEEGPAGSLRDDGAGPAGGGARDAVARVDHASVASPLPRPHQRRRVVALQLQHQHLVFRARELHRPLCSERPLIRLQPDDSLGELVLGRGRRELLHQRRRPRRRSQAARRQLQPVDEGVPGRRSRRLRRLAPRRRGDAERAVQRRRGIDWRTGRPPGLRRPGPDQHRRRPASPRGDLQGPHLERCRQTGSVRLHHRL